MGQTKTPPKSRRARAFEWALPWGAAIAVALLSFHWSRLYHYNVCDDSLISFRYAENLANGRGLVFNAGERVEGYTNFLWVIALSILDPLTSGAREFVRAASTLSILVSAVDVLLLFAVARLLFRDRLVPTAVALLVVVVDNDYTVWAIQALEGHFVIFWMLVSTWLWFGPVQRARGLLTGAALALLTMTRPDAVLFVAALFGSEAIGLLRARPPWRPLAAACASFIVLYGAYFAWRYGYYDSLLPNTFYAKAAGLRTEAIGRGLTYLVSFLEMRAYLPALALLAVPLCAQPIVRALLVWLVLHVAYVVWVGGDFYPGARFLLVTVPVTALLIGTVVGSAWAHLGEGRATIGRTVGRAVLLTAALSVVLIVARRGLALGPARTEVARWAEEIERTRTIMEIVGERADPGASILTGDIGSSGFYAKLRVHDVYGIVDREVAHQEVADFGRAKAGHEKRMTPAMMRERQADFIKDGYFPGDLYREGYYFDTEFPPELRYGIWRRDRLPEQGRYLPSTRELRFGAVLARGWFISNGDRRRWIALRAAPGQMEVRGSIGYFLSTFDPEQGDRATVTLRSPPFRIDGDRIVLRVAGGRDAERLRVSLVVEGDLVRSTTGHDDEIFARRIWDVGSFRGMTGVVEVVDRSTGGWGHIMVDEIRQWTASGPGDASVSPASARATGG